MLNTTTTHGLVIPTLSLMERINNFPSLFGGTLTSEQINFLMVTNPSVVSPYNAQLQTAQALIALIENTKLFESIIRAMSEQYFKQKYPNSEQCEYDYQQMCYEAYLSELRFAREAEQAAKEKAEQQQEKSSEHTPNTDALSQLSIATAALNDLLDEQEQERQALTDEQARELAAKMREQFGEDISLDHAAMCALLNTVHHCDATVMTPEASSPMLQTILQRQHPSFFTTVANDVKRYNEIEVLLRGLRAAWNLRLETQAKILQESPLVQRIQTLRPAAIMTLVPQRQHMRDIVERVITQTEAQRSRSTHLHTPPTLRAGHTPQEVNPQQPSLTTPTIAPRVK